MILRHGQDIQTLVIGIHEQCVSGMDFGRDNLSCNQRFHMGLQITLQRTCTIDGIKALVDDVGHRSICELNAQLAVLQTAVEAFEHQAHDGADLVAGERLVIHNLINTVEEFGAEVGLEQTVNLRAGFRRNISVMDSVEDEIAAQIACHDQNGVLEVHGSALRVGDPAVVENLQEDVEDIRMRLFDLIKEDD